MTLVRPRRLGARIAIAPRRAALTACALAGALLFAAAAEARTYIVGGKAYTEQYVLAEVTKQMLEREGIESQTRVGYSTVDIRQAQLAGDVDISWDYTWIGYTVHHGFTEPRDADSALEEIRRLDVENGLIWLPRSKVNNSPALAVNLDFAAENCIHSLIDLSQALRNGLSVRMASDQECHKREDCLLGVQRAYDFKIPPENITVMNVAETHEALRLRRAEVAVVYVTDGKIPAYDLELLEDPKGAFNAYFITPVVSATALEETPRIRPLLERVAAALDTETLQDLNYRVDIVGQPVEQVARYFITSKGL